MGKEANPDRPDDSDRPAHRADAGTRRRVPPDDRLTTILPPVVDDRAPRQSDPIDQVRAALDGPVAKPRDAIEEVKAALDGRPAPPRRDRTLSGQPPDGPPPPPRRAGA
ncbi:penicillin-binding protein 1A, partial [Mycobacterium montefiorense]